MWKFEKSGTRKQNYLHHSYVEVCFLGRSNVGKSTLINALAKSRIANVSSTPGRTRTINFFSAGNFYFADLPGYGYAKASKKERQEMLAIIDEYIRFRAQVNCFFLLIDSRIGPTKDDLLMIEYFKENSRTFFIVITKSDKANQSQLYKTKQIISKITTSYLDVSARNGKNIKQLKQRVYDFFKT